MMAESVVGAVWGPWYGGSGLFYPWFPILWIVFPALFFLAIFLFFRFRRRYWCPYGWGNGPWGGNNSTPEEILRLRLARGDITRQEYQELLEEVQKK